MRNFRIYLKKTLTTCVYRLTKLNSTFRNANQKKKVKLFDKINLNKRALTKLT
jgi:hypothetical protein